MFNQFLYTLLILFSVSGALYAEEIQIPFIVENACPFEGCTFGDWRVLSETNVYEQPDKNSHIVASLKANTSVNVVSGIEVVSPGRAIVIGEPYSHKELIDSDKEILILNYWGEGRSQVFQSGNFFTTKIARTKSECTERPNGRNCWVKVLQEPVSNWWVKAKDLGWVLMEKGNLRPINAFSSNVPYNKCLKRAQQSCAA